MDQLYLKDDEYKAKSIDRFIFSGSLT